jgi:glycine/D-amino acid oxidase-like deaminating enzyme
MAPPFPLAPALWHATAAAPPPTPPLDETIAADVAIVGAGYAGLAAALHLAENGARVVVLEAREPGFGASGRSGGQVIPGLKYDPDELEARFGREAGAALAEFAGRTADAVFDLIATRKLDVPHARAGWIQGAHSAAALDLVKRRAEQWAKRGAPVELLDKPGADRYLGTPAYRGGWIDKRGGAVQPLSFTRELARVALGAGARIHGASPVASIAREGARWRVATRLGTAVLAERVLICTNGYSDDLWPKLRQTVIAANSFQIATAPLGDNLRKSIMPMGHVTSDTRRLLLYFRLDHTGRFIMGGRGPFREPRGPQDWSHLARVAARMFPQLGAATWQHRWCGRVALTQDFLPYLHEPEPGITIAIGCQGRGIGLHTAMGLAIARRFLKPTTEPLPVSPTPITPIPLHGMHRAWVSALVAWYRLTDRV